MEIQKFQEIKEGITFSLMVQPRSSKNEITINPSGFLKLKLTSPPLEGAANKLCIKLLSHWLNISKSNIHIINGLKRKNKVIKIIGIHKRDFNLFIKNVKNKPLRN